MKYLLIGLLFFISCGNLEQEAITIYFDNGIIDDKPLGFPKFLELESKYPGLIYSLNELPVKRDEIETIINKIRSGRNIKGGALEKEVEDIGIGAIYIINDRDTLFFNTSNKFYTAQNNFIFRDKDLANRIRGLIHYDKTIEEGVTQDKPSPLYYKVIMKPK